MLGSAIDNAILAFAPKWGAKRMAFRQYAERIRDQNTDHASMRKMMSGRDGGYEAGKADRLKGRTIGPVHENDIPYHQLERLRWRSWNLYRNCPQARKIARTLGAKVIGRGLAPQPQTMTSDGKPFVGFRQRAREVWGEFTKECDFRGKPGSGGQHMTPLSKTALRGTMLSGGILFRFHHLDRMQQIERGLMVPLQVQLLHVDRLDQQKAGPNIYRGIQVDALGRIEGYWVLRGGVSNGQIPETESTLVEVAKMKHLFAEEDIDQFIGAPWLGPAAVTMGDRRGLEINELIASEMATCVVGTYQLSPGQTQFGLTNPSSPTELTDAQGNPVTHLQPGMLLNASKDQFNLHNPSRPNAHLGEYVSYLVRNEAVSVPGVKSSTLTGDYRESSFSSERSADNDTWPEIEEMQDWFSIGFCQPIYEECITTAVTAGLFDAVEGFSAADFKARKREYIKTNWQGPVARSINPKDDAAAAGLRVKATISTPQLEAAKEGRDWRENIDAISEFIQYCEERGVPSDIWQQALGIEQRDEPGTEEPATTEQEQDAAAKAGRLSRLRASQFVALNSA